MDSNRFLKIVIVVLLIINIGTLGFMWVQHGHIGPPPPRGGEDVALFLTHELMFSKDQEKQFELLRTAHHEGVEQIQHGGRSLHDRFFDLIQQPTPDTLLVQQMADSIAAIQKEIELLTFHHFQKVRAICTPEQQKKFDEIIDEALRMMAPRPPGPNRR
jgi:Spy/CpxP family protein refolding chaperone